MMDLRARRLGILTIGVAVVFATAMGSGATLVLRMKRYAETPTERFPQ